MVKLRGGFIRAAAFIEVEDVIVQITDRGQGISPEQLNAVWIRDHSQSGVGIRNVNERLKLSFGPNYGLSIVNTHNC